MDETQARLTRCFSAVFPSLTGASVPTAAAANTEGWDSVASVTLFATVEEEFGIELDLNDPPALLSFAGLLDYLRNRPSLRL
jgi:acyl carrier protein